MMGPDYAQRIGRCESAYRLNPDIQNLHQLMLALIRCGDMRFYMKAYDEAASVFRKAIQYTESSEHLTAIEIQRDLAECYTKLGDTCQEQKDLVMACGHYEKSMHIREAVTAQSGAVADIRVLCICCLKTAGAYENQDHPKDAEACLKKCLELCMQIAAQSPKEYDLQLLARVYDAWGIHWEIAKNLSEANKQYQEGLRLCLQLVGASDSHQNRELLAFAYYNVY